MKHTHELLRTRFDDETADPMASMANLVDIMLVFACGLIAALISQSGGLEEYIQKTQQKVERTRELPQIPDGIGDDTGGFIPVGQVYKDPETGELILVK